LLPLYSRSATGKRKGCAFILYTFVNVTIIYFGMTKLSEYKNTHVILILSLLFLLFINIILYNFGSIFKLFYYKIIGLSGILVSIIYGIIYIILEKVNIGTLRVFYNNYTYNNNNFMYPFYIN
jgi:hypothetical protein